ncbi:(ABC) transporter [Coemansia sp. IMI 203386]|nr:(ABC) transporter [Coemansia sp. IMI 203386]
MQSAAPFEIGGFNLDNILNLMAGDTQGNVDFGAIGIEVAQNLANVIDMNEVGNMATALGMMMSGIGVATEIQRQNSENRNVPNNDQNAIINSGVAALLQQVLSNSQVSADTIPRQGSENIFNAIGSNNLNAAQLVNLVAGGQGGNLDMQGIVNAFGNVMGSGQDSRNPGVKRETQQHQPIAGTSVLKNNIANSETGPADTAESIVAGRKAQNTQNYLPVENKNDNTATAADTGVRKIASLMDDLVNGDDTSGMAGIAQAIGIRNFFRTDNKKIPDGCPTCFNYCLQPACLSPLDGVKRPAAKSGHCHQDTECRPGWGGWNCNMCLNDAACDALNPTGEGGRCYNGSELITNVVGQCYVGNADLGRYLPDGVTPKMTFGCDRNSSSCSAQFWLSGKESFYCNLDQCDIGTWGSKSTAAINCKRMKCHCIPGRFLCGNYGLDIASVLSEVEGPVDIKCHDDGFSNCYIREFMISKTLAAIIGDDAINMKCTVGQCVHYSQLPDYKRPVAEASKGNMLLGISTSLFTVYVVLRVIRMLVKNHDQRESPLETSSSKAADSSDMNNRNAVADSKTSTLNTSRTTTTNEISDMMKNTLRATVSFRNISYTIPVQGPDLVSLKSLGVNIGSSSQLNGISSNAQTIANSHDINAKSVQVLKNISGVVKPGEILAILGASGAGKSTLLDILSRREKCGVVTGKVQVNDKDIISGITTEEFHRMSGYVDQQDLHVATATVYETVLTSALLRLPQAMSRAAKEERVRDVLQELGLWTVRDSKIGKIGARGISGGEMRRVSIACELVTSPSIIFLDEPTSGLDAYNAFVVMDTLSKLARRYGRTVICTIHQPRTDIFSMFDQLIVLAAGQMCYSGPAEDIANYLGTIGHPVPDGYNIADFSIDLVQQATVTSAKELAGSPKPSTDNSAGVSEKSQTLSLEKSNDVQPSDDEWDPLLGTSSVSLTATKYNNTKPEVTRQKGSQFIVYNAHVSLNKILDSFQASNQCKRITEQLDNLTGPEWTASPFDKVSSIGGVPHMRPVTPLQQVVVIFLNIYDLLTLLYNRLRGRRVGTSFKDELRPPVFEQFKILSARIFRHLYRDPTLMLANYAMSVFIGLMCGVLFYQLDSSVQGVQNRLGLIMFVLAFYGFGATTSLLVFAEERLLYLRERANAYYDPMAYFLAKVTFDLIPLRVVPPMLLTLIMYPMTGLAATWHQFIKFFSTLVLFNLTTASQMFFIGLLAEQLVVSNFLASLVLLFSLLFGGLILNKESIPSMLQPLFGTSSFNLAYEALAINELRYAHIEEVRFGLEIEVPTAALISSFGFNLQAFWPDITFMFIVLAVSLGMSLLWLTFVIKERR